MKRYVDTSTYKKQNDPGVQLVLVLQIFPNITVNDNVAPTNCNQQWILFQNGKTDNRN
jgi:hypothetical protein